MKLQSTAKYGVAGLLLAGLAGSIHAEPVYVADDTCNVNGIPKMKSADQRAHVFNARLGNKGKGNGGEATDAQVLLDLPTGDPDDPFVVGLTCISTADEDTGGTISLELSDGTVVDPAFGTTAETDPGN